MNMKQLVKKSISQRTLFTDAFGFMLMKSGFSDKYLTGQITMYKSYNWVKRHFIKVLNSITTKQDQYPCRKKVWICWLQGIEK